MDFISFKNIKLFKGTGAQKKKNGSPPPASKEKAPLWKQIVENPILHLVIFVFFLSYFLSYVPSKMLPRIEVGEIASADVVSPRDLTIEDTETTANRRAEAEESVLPVYTFDENAFLNTEERIRQFFAFGQEWLKRPAASRSTAELQKDIAEKFGADIPARELETLLRAGFSPELAETLISLIGKISSPGIIVSKNLFIRKEPERGFILMRGPGNEKLTKVDEILEIKESREKFAAEAEKIELPPRQKSLLRSLADAFITPNITYNKVETEVRKERARARVDTVFYRIKKGKVIIRKGDEATAETLKLVAVINQHLREERGWLRNFAGTWLLFALIFLTLWYYLKSLLKFRAAQKIFLMMGVTLILSLLSYKLSNFLAAVFSKETTLSFLTDIEAYKYAFPCQLGVILFAFLTTNTISLIFAILNSLLVGYFFQGHFSLMLYSFIGGLAAIYGIKYYQRQKRTSALRAGLFVVAPVNIFLILTYELIGERLSGMDVIATKVGMGLIGGILSASIAFLLLPVIELVFGFVTQTKLLELSNSELPIFRQMAMEAPGSYHHSLIVATLAEKAAEEIGLDSMLVKTGALYHDIGKVKRPEYFIENMARNPDLHKDLTPSMSTLVIINHVKEGVEMAKKLKLPRKIKDIIAQHHGSSLVRYFYEKAKEKYDPDMQTIGEESYRYPGPSPLSKEAALIMLADSVEAASRSLKSPTRESLKRVITEIFESYLQDGQLDACDFSLRELRSVAAAFHSALYAIYHPRVEYPGFDFEMKKKKKAANSKKGNDRSPKPST
ncbi:MAG: HDIG domain-containing protein [Clostridiales bacterium]|nr:HDIG domain-containing protein [Clostridiales bacterium]